MLVGNPAFAGILDTGYWMLDGRFPIGLALRKDARCWLERIENPAFAGIPITGRGDDQVSLSSIQHRASSIYFNKTFPDHWDYTIK